MATEKITLSLDRETLDLARQEAELSGQSLSAWLSEAALAKALRDGARRLNDWIRATPDKHEAIMADIQLAAEELMSQENPSPTRGAA